MSIAVDVKYNNFRVHEPCNIELLVRPSFELRARDIIEFLFPNSWLIVHGPDSYRDLQTSDPDKSHYVQLETDIPHVVFDLDGRKYHSYFPDGYIRQGRLFMATIASGYIPANYPIRIKYSNTYAPFIAEEEEIWLRIGDEIPNPLPILKVKPNPFKDIRVLAPSGVEPGQQFHVCLVSLDEYDNCSSTTFKDESLFLQGIGCISTSLTFTGCTTVPVSIDREGIYRFLFRGIQSNAVRVKRGVAGPYWGDIHIHSKVSFDGQGTAPYDYARNVSYLDFASVTDHCESMGEMGYSQILRWAEDSYVPGNFVTLLGDERNPRRYGGHHNLYFSKKEDFLKYRYIAGEKPFDIVDDERLAGIDSQNTMLIPHHTGICWGDLNASNDSGNPDVEMGYCAVNVDACDDSALYKNVEIYSFHGQSELYAPQHILAYELNRLRLVERSVNTSTDGPHYAQHFWKRKKYLGVVASSDDHTGRGGRRKQGITAVWVESLTREQIFKALANRRCYGTTGERILVDFSINEFSIGEIGHVKKHDKLAIKLDVWGTSHLIRVEILKYRYDEESDFKPVLSAGFESPTLDASYQIEDSVRGDSLYYARITQEPFEWPDMAWTSPIWIIVV